MSRVTATCRLAQSQTVLPFTLSALCCALLAPVALADASTGPANELSPTVVTAVAPSSPLTVITNPKDPRQPAPAPQPCLT